MRSEGDQKSRWFSARSGWADGLVIGLALVVLGGALAWAAWDLRARIRGQVVQQDAEILDAVAQMQHLNDQAGGETIATLEDPGEQFQLALKVSRLHSVLGVRLYANDGRLVNAFPAYITEATLPAADLARLRNLKPVSRFSDRASLKDQEMLADANATAALLLVEVPLRGGKPGQLAGVIQFVMDGSSIARQFADLDRNLILKFGAAYLAGAAILIVGLGFALHRVRQANRKLAERTAGLLQANRELALAARTSAVGAVTAHLIHGLRNPLSGLRDFVRLHNEESGRAPDAEWQMALGTTQRMEELINRVVRVLQERQLVVEYEISPQELVALLDPKAKALGGAAGVRFETEVRSEGKLSNREADLILLILENLVQNAIEATPAGRTVTLTIADETGQMVFEVGDQGPGLPPGMKARWFMPGTSGKKGGGGIGLAISRQLAQSIGAQLDLAASGPDGCTFRLAILPSPPEIDRQSVVEKRSVLKQPG